MRPQTNEESPAGRRPLRSSSTGRAKEPAPDEASTVEGGPSAEDTTQPASAAPQAVAERAYQLFLSRGCENGHDVEDWLAAERELTTLRS